MYGIEAEISTTGDAEQATFAELSDGIDNLSEALNEVVQQYFFMSGQGFATNEVTGMAPAVTLTGRRIIGDPAQDYIFSKKYALGSERKTKFRLTFLNSENKKEILECEVTICNMQEWSGATTDHSAISFEIRFNGKPTVNTELT